MMNVLKLPKNWMQHRIIFRRSVRRKHIIIVLPLFFFPLLKSSLKTSRETDKSSVDLSTTSLLSPALPFAASKVASSCAPKHLCRYNNKVDFRIIVTTYNRPTSLLKLLASIEMLELDSHSAALEIWIDRKRKTGEVYNNTVKAATEFHWSRGPTRVYVHSQHVGIYGQWIDTWRPPDESDDELALILEDDLSISMYAYRWVRAVFRAYSHRVDFAGASLTSHQMTILSPRPKGRLAGPQNHTAIMYKCFGTWGFAPKPMHWRRFQVWTNQFYYMWAETICTPMPVNQTYAKVVE